MGERPRYINLRVGANYSDDAACVQNDESEAGNSNYFSLRLVGMVSQSFHVDQSFVLSNDVERRSIQHLQVGGAAMFEVKCNSS